MVKSIFKAASKRSIWRRLDKTGDLKFGDFVVKDWRPLLGGRERRRKHQGCYGEGFRNAIFGEKKKMLW